ncbi:MAG: hypothetical protein V1899_07705 [Planctomycetota bacterium]
MTSSGIALVLACMNDTVNAVELDQAYRANTPEPNAATYYEAGFALACVHTKQEESIIKSLPIIGTGKAIELDETPSAEIIRNIEAYLANKRDGLNSIRKGASLDACSYSIDLSKGYGTLQPHFSKIRQCARLLSLENLGELSQGHADAVASNIVVMFRLAGSLRNEPLLISSLVRAAILPMAVGNIQRAFTHTRLSNDRLRELSQAATAETDIVNMKRLFIGERNSTNRRIIQTLLANYESLLLVQAACAVEMHRNDKGQLPESLDALVPQYLSKIPDDVFAERNIRYAKDTKGYRLWSVGPDGKDNGGVTLKEGAYDEGSDIVFRAMR